MASSTRPKRWPIATAPPQGWAAIVASDGPGSESKPVGFQELTNPAYRGLRMIPGTGPYPLTESFMARTIGVGVRHRGAAVALQITESANYTPPTIVAHQ